MKKVLDANTVARYWANQTQEEGRNSGHNFYFDGNTIYSYGRHFPIAKHLDGKVLMTLRTYSNTTAKHIRMVQSAASHLSKIYCYELPHDKKDLHTHNGNIERWLKILSQFQ